MGENSPPRHSTLLAMRDAMTHRGPDDAGIRMSPGCALLSRRLAILDLSPRGHMPMGSADGRYWIVHNGEVYNFADLRGRLQGLGHHFESRTDTEVILNAYAEFGPEMLDWFNGMFAFAIWDEREQTLFAARDRMGIKPFFYAEHDGALLFASEIKALITAGVPARFDRSTSSELMAFGHVAGERTPFVGIKRLLPGHCLTWKGGRLTTKCWWSLRERIPDVRGQSLGEPVSYFTRTFNDSVNLRRIADVPVGVLLSGGVDSGSIAASLASQAGRDVASFTVRFKEPGYDEGSLARELADQWHLQYNELYLEGHDLLTQLTRATRFNDEPLMHGSDPHLLAISELAKSKVTVLLSGEGADETLGGYVRYRPLRFPRLLNSARALLSPWLGQGTGWSSRWGKLSRYLQLGGMDAFVHYNSAKMPPSELTSVGLEPRVESEYRAAIHDEARSLYPGEPVRQAMYLDQHCFLGSILDRNDRMTMGASIECRVPFLDYRLVEAIAALPTQCLFRGTLGKMLLRRSQGAQLPRSIRKHRKWGFGVPWHVHLRDEPDLRELIRDLPQLPPFTDPPFDAHRIRQIAEDSLNGSSNQQHLVLQLVLIALWHGLNFDSGPTVISSPIDSRMDSATEPHTPTHHDQGLSASRAILANPSSTNS